MPSQGQPNPKGCRSGLMKPHVEVKALVAPHAGQFSELSPIHPDTKNTLYAGGKLVPKLVTAESCVVDGIPDPRSNDNTELQQMCDLKLQSDAQEVLPPCENPTPVNQQTLSAKEPARNLPRTTQRSQTRSVPTSPKTSSPSRETRNVHSTESFLFTNTQNEMS